MNNKDLYKILNISKTATKSEVQKAFRKLAKEYHPDVNPGDDAAEQKFKEITFAYEVLKDDKKRAKYDQMSSMGAFGQSGAAGGFGGRGGWHQPQGGSYGTAQDFSDMGLGDLFEEIFGGFSGVDPRSGGPRSGLRRKGADREADLVISFLEAARGGQRQIELGQNQRLTVKIPSGVETGSKIKLRGKGESGQGGAPSGDLIINLKVLHHEYFKRDGNDVVLRLPISVKESIMGAMIKIPTLDGEVTLKVPPGVSSHQRLKLKSKGIESRSGQRGDQYVELQIKVPKNVPETYHKAALALEHDTFDPREGLF